MNDFLGDPHLDSQLRDVPLPEALVERLRQARVPHGDELDAAIRAVALPNAFSSRLYQAIEAESLDERLRDVPLPASVLVSLRSLPFASRRSSRLSRMALAASLMLIVGFGYLAAMAGVLASVIASGTMVREIAVMDFPPLRIESGRPVESITLDDAAIVFLADDRGGLGLSQAGEAMEPALDSRFTIQPARGGPVDEMLAQFVSHWRPLDDLLLLRIGPLGASGSTDDNLPPLESVAPPRVQGMEPPVTSPRQRAFDRSFLITRGVFPPSFPALDSRLREIRVPLIASSASWQATRDLVRQGRLPEVKGIRVEEFLAAFDYGFEPARPGQVAIRTAAGPSIFGPSQAALVQVGVVAGDLPRRAGAGSHVTLAVDVSSSMNWNGRWDRVRRGIGGWLDGLSPRDRVSMVAFNDEPVQRIEGASRADAAMLRETLDSLAPSGGSNLAEGLREAVSMACSPIEGGSVESRLVLITDARARLSRDNAEMLRSLVALAAQGGLRVSVFDVSESGSDEWLSQLAELGRGDYLPLSTPDEIQWQLYRTSTESSGVVAADAVLRVEFNPAAVHAYRLLGHEPTLAGLASGAVEQSLRAGETATALFEVWLLDNSVNEVAWAEVEWHDPETGATRKTPRQRISRLQFATSLAEMSLSLQAAAVLAETAEVLRQGYQFSLDGTPIFATRPKPASVQHILKAAEQMNPRLTEQEKFREVLGVIGRIEEVAGRR